MSDYMSPPAKSKYESKIEISTQVSPFYSNKKSVSEVALSITITNEFIKKLNSWSVDNDFSFVQTLNSQLSFFQLKECERLNSRLRTMCAKVVSDYKTKFRGGRKREEYNSNSRQFHVFKSELYDVYDLNCKLTKFEIENAKLEKKCCDLVNAFQNIKCEKDEALIEIEALKSQNKILAEYIENKFPNDNFTNSGKVFDDLKTRQISRKIRTFETYA